MPSLGVKPSANRPAGRPQTLRQHPHHFQGKMRCLADHEQELAFTNRDKLHIRDRNGGRTARLVVDQRHFAENIVGRKLRQSAIAELDSYLSAPDHEELVGLITLAKDDAPGLDELGFDIVAGK